jgi:ferredoxin
MKISVDQSVCVGAGQCVLAAESVFQQGIDDGLVELLNADPSPEQEAGVTEAELICPSGANSYIA